MVEWQLDTSLPCVSIRSHREVFSHEWCLPHQCAVEAAVDEKGASTSVVLREQADSQGSSVLASPLITFLSGAIAGVVSKTVTAPLDRLKTMDQVGDGTSQASVAQRLRFIYKQGGLSSLLQGNSANACKSMPEVGIKFWCNDQMRMHVCHDVTAPSASERLLCGATAGATSCISIYPLEVAKTR